jgi:hypothetical protein
MRILYIAEIVSRPGIYCVKTLLGKLRKEREIDFVIANGDGTTGGYGIGKNHSMYLRKLGVDVITGGDQTFYKKDMVEHVDNAYYMLRRANLSPDTPRRGWRHFTVRPQEWSDVGGERPDSEDDVETESTDEASRYPGVKIAVLSILGQSGFERLHANNPFTYFLNVLDRMTKNSSAVIVDFHALTTAEKYTMFSLADGKATAVIGSGQRVQTADATVLPGGTAVICDAGRTGSRGSVSGFAYRPETQKFLTGVPISSEDAWDDLVLQGAVIEIDIASGYVLGIEPISQSCKPPKKSAGDS